jgi:hypothetical protein
LPNDVLLYGYVGICFLIWKKSAKNQLFAFIIKGKANDNDNSNSRSNKTVSIIYMASIITKEIGVQFYNKETQ